MQVATIATNICLATALLGPFDHENEVPRIHRIVGNYLPINTRRSPGDVNVQLYRSGKLRSHNPQIRVMLHTLEKAFRNFV